MSCRAWPLFALLPLVGAAGQSDLSLPADARLACGAGVACPDGFACSERTGRCLAVEAADAFPPAVVETTVRLAPVVAGANAEVAVSFETTEPLERPPEVSVDLPWRPRLALVAREGRRFELAYVPDGREPQGQPVALVATLVDTAGNVARDIPLGTVEFDFEAPSVSEILVEGGSHLRRGGRGLVVFTVDEALPAAPLVVLGSSGAPLSLHPGSEPPAYRYGYRVRPEDVEGAFGVEVTVVDAAGNRAARSAADAFLLDFSPPVVVGEPDLINKEARPGTTILVALTTSEEVTARPRVTLRGEGGAPGPSFEASQGAGRDHVFTHAVGDGEDGVWDVVVEGAEDLAGNAMQPWTAEQAFRIDSVPPALTAGPRLDKEPAHYRAGERVAVRFSVSEALHAYPPVVTLDTLEPRSLPCLPADGEDFVCTLADPLTGSELPLGEVGLSVELRDDAGNATLASTAATLDFRGPRLAGAPRLARCDGRALAQQARDDLWLDLDPGCPEGTWPLEVTFAVDEETSAAESPAVAVGGRPLTRLEGEPGDAWFRYGYRPSGDEDETDSAAVQADGQVVAAEVLDRAGNPARLVLGTVRFDFTAPELTADEATLARLKLVRDPWGSERSGYVPRTYVEVAPDAFAEPGQVCLWAVTERPAPPGGEAGDRRGWTLLRTGAFAPGLPARIVAGDVDVPVVYLSFSDRAGNATDAEPDTPGSQPLALSLVEWVATLVGHGGGDDAATPHTLWAGVGDADGPLDLDASVRQILDRVQLRGAARAGDGAAASASTALTPWTLRHSGREPPPLFFEHGQVAYDTHRDRIVLFGGFRAGRRGPL